MNYAHELDSVLPVDLPHRDHVIRGAARHLELVDEANKVLNLTRISSPREAAIKHILDSVIPWRLFQGARRVLDAGTGAGFPGIPLALVLPETRFTLAESIQKKARFVQSALAELNLPNVQIVPRRAEDPDENLNAEIITARALAPISKILKLFRPALRSGTRLLLYKGPDIAQEIADAGKTSAKIEIVMRYELPDALGSRTIVQITGV